MVNENGTERNAHALDLVRQKVDVIFTLSGSNTAVAAKNSTRTVPIVFLSSGDPVGRGLVASLSHPGGNVTGVAAPTLEVLTKGVQILAEATKKMTKIAFMHPRITRSVPWFDSYIARVTRAATELGIHSELVSFASIEEVAPLVRQLTERGVDGIQLLGDGSENVDWKRVSDVLIAYRLPSIGDIDDGNLVEYKFSAEAQAQIAARLLARILDGAHPADLPVEQVSTFQLGINLRTANALGIRISSALLLQATRVVR